MPNIHLAFLLQTFSLDLPQLKLTMAQQGIQAVDGKTTYTDERIIEFIHEMIDGFNHRCQKTTRGSFVKCDCGGYIFTV